MRVERCADCGAMYDRYNFLEDGVCVGPCYGPGSEGWPRWELDRLFAAALNVGMLVDSRELLRYAG